MRARSGLLQYTWHFFSEVPFVHGLCCLSFLGPIPASLQSLTNLRELRLSQNLFSGGTLAFVWNECQSFCSPFSISIGSVPEEIGTLKRLRHLDLENNQLSGAHFWFCPFTRRLWATRPCFFCMYERSYPRGDPANSWSVGIFPRGKPVWSESLSWLVLNFGKTTFCCFKIIYTIII